MGQHIAPRDNTWIPGLDGINFLSFAHEKAFSFCSLEHSMHKKQDESFNGVSR